MKLEEANSREVLGPAILCESEETNEEALARWVEKHGPTNGGEPLFIRFVGVEPGAHQ